MIIFLWKDRWIRIEVRDGGGVRYLKSQLCQRGIVLLLSLVQLLPYREFSIWFSPSSFILYCNLFSLNSIQSFIYIYNSI